MPIKTFVILSSIVVGIPGCHAEDRGSIPRRAARNNLFSYSQLPF